MPHFTTRRRVEFAETDMAGIVHFANFFKWMEEAEHQYFRSLGLAIMQPREDGTYIGWPRVSASCNFRAPLTYEDEVELHVTVERVGLKSVTYVVEMTRDGREVAVGRMKVACCLCGPSASIESVEIPEEYLARLPREESEAADA